MIYVTGDTHGDFQRFGMKIFPQQKNMMKSDYVIICGDFGAVWDDSPSERYWLDWLHDKPFTTLFVDGNHENFDRLYALPVAEWHGGKVHYIRDSIIHLMRGQIYHIEDMTFFTMGGAQSHDIDDGILDRESPTFHADKERLQKYGGRFRINHESWWNEELPSDAEYAEALANLTASERRVNFIISHCCPTSLLPSLGKEPAPHPDKLTNFFDTLKSRCTYDKWFFGHYHENLELDAKHNLLYKQIIQLS